MKHFLALLFFAVGVLCTQLHGNVEAAALDVHLSSIGNMEMRTVLTNTGPIDIALFNRGNILDHNPTRKVSMFSSNDSRVPFEGVRFSMDITGNISAGDLTPIPIGQSVTVDFDASSMYDLSAGGKFKAVSEGTIYYAEGNSTVLQPMALIYESNLIEINVDASAITIHERLASNLKAVPQTGVAPISDAYCQGTWKNDLYQALKLCEWQAKAGADAARLGGPRFEKYFKLITPSAIKAVAQRLTNIAEECAIKEIAQDPWYITMTCNDFSNLCAANPGANAYELGGRFINICPRGFTFSPWGTECHVTDLGGIVVHEMSHATTVYSPGTGDLARGYENSIRLSAGIALMNADNYAWFANDAYLTCPLP